MKNENYAKIIPTLARLLLHTRLRDLLAQSAYYTEWEKKKVEIITNNMVIKFVQRKLKINN